MAIYPVYTHPKKRGKRSKPTTEIQQRFNQRHTEGRLRRLLHTNFTPSDLFATLTFDDANLPASVEDAQRLLQNFLRRLKRKYTRLGLDAKYIYVLEYGQEHNRFHIHLVLTGGITRADLEKLWGLGDVNADALRFEKDGLATLAKYLTKGGGTDDQERPTWKRWSGSCNGCKSRLKISLTPLTMMAKMQISWSRATTIACSRLLKILPTQRKESNILTSRWKMLKP